MVNRDATSWECGHDGVAAVMAASHKVGKNATSISPVTEEAVRHLKVTLRPVLNRRADADGVSSCALTII